MSGKFARYHLLKDTLSALDEAHLGLIELADDTGREQLYILARDLSILKDSIEDTVAGRLGDGSDVQDTEEETL